jgi:lytic murein transglycosylase
MVRALALALLVGCAPAAPVGVSTAPRRALRPPRPAPPPALPPAPSASVSLAPCGDTEVGFDAWLASYRAYAEAQGIPGDVVQRALADVTYDASVIALDRAQRARKVSFEAFAASHVTKARVRRGQRHLAAHAELLSRLERRFGVPGEVLVAIWGLETDFGQNQGTTPSLRALATLAYDCRRAERFRGELESALRIVARGDLRVDEMVGAWAGEVGQTQFLPSSYEQFGIDVDGDGRVDVVGSVPDALGSTANYLSMHGWHGGEPYAEGTPNFEVLTSWNKSEVYRRTIALFASKLAGTP